MGEALVRHPDLAIVETEPQARVAIMRLHDLASTPVILTDTAALIWSRIDGSRDLDRVIASVADQVGLEPGEIEGDVVAFVEELRATGLLER